MRALMGAVVAMGLTDGAAQAQVIEAPVQQNYTGVSFNVEKTGALVVIAWPYNANGKVAICGAVFAEKESSGLAARKVDMLKNLVFSLGGKQTNARATAFTMFASEEAAVAKRTGRCSITKLPWNDRYAKEKVKIDGRYDYIRG